MISKSVLYLEIANLIFSFYMLIQTLFFPESPRYQYAEELFDESRTGLATVARFNSAEKFTTDFKFDTEQEAFDLKKEGFEVASKKQLDGGNEYGLS